MNSYIANFSGLEGARMNAQIHSDILSKLSTMPVRGEGLNHWLFVTALRMSRYFCESEIIEILQQATASQPVKRGEIERAARRAKEKVDHKLNERRCPSIPRATAHSHWGTLNMEQRGAVIATNDCGLYDLWEASPVRCTPIYPTTETVIDHLFPGNPLLCCGRSKWEFATKPREDWRNRMTTLALIVPNPMTTKLGRTQEGKPSAHTLQNTGSRRFLVIEQDAGTADEQAAVLMHLAEKAPLALAVHSGGKSIHGWFFCHGQPEERLQAFMHHAVTIGADKAMWTRSQFCRMPGGTRENGNKQCIYFLNPEVLKCH
ncbi:MAG: hypothetical protein JWL59_3098 [Chthoniobacteraceae bacterium]|nr:hypothetical protein [Chthoniobacteraceae bacterium]